MTNKDKELALHNGRIIALLPIESWLDTCQDVELRKLLLALLEVKRTMEERK